MRVVPALVALGCVIALAGCTSSSSPGTSEEIKRLRQAAHLDRCPVSDPTAAPASQGVSDLTFDCLGNGPKVTLSELRGRPALINVWGSWCEPCQREVPALQQVHEEAHDELLVLGVDTEDSSASALDFAAHAGMTYPSVVDESGTFHRDLGRGTVPMTLFVNRDGEVVHTSYGQFHGIDDVKAQLEQYLGVAL